MKVKSSFVLQEALNRIIAGDQRFACAAIQDVETDLRYANNGKDVKTNASKIFASYKPESIPVNMQASQAWWPKDSSDRIAALTSAIKVATKRGD